MTKQEFVAHFTAMYRVGNMADSDSPQREGWTHHTMAAESCCQPLDAMMHSLVLNGVFTDAERQEIYDTL